MAKCKQNSAQRRTLDLLAHIPTDEDVKPTHPTEKAGDTRGQTTVQPISNTCNHTWAEKWCESDISAHDTKVIVARFRNGSRALQFASQKRGTKAEFIITADMWVSLAQVVFRDSVLVRKLLLCTTDQQRLEYIDAIRAFMGIGSTPEPETDV